MSTYPIDTDDIHKGDLISVERLEYITGHKRTDPAFRHKVLALRRFIEEDIAHRRNEVVTLKSEGDALRVLTDEEAAKYNPRRFDSGLRTMGKAHYRDLGVDASGFTESQLREHDRNLVTQGAVLQAARRAKRRPVLKPVERTTPRLAPKKDDEPEK